jgi:cell division protein FtsA
MGMQTRQAVGLDIGSTKVSAVIGEITPEGNLDIIGIGSRPSKGLRKGVIVDLNSTMQAMLRVIEDAEMMAGTRIDSVHVGVSGSQLESLTTEVSIELPTKEVTPREIQQVIELARSHISTDQYEPLGVVPVEYRLDDETGLSNPIGRQGTKLGIRAYIIVASRPAIDLLTKMLDQAKIAIEAIVAQPMASARAVLTPEERDQGVVLLDIGGGTTDITVYGDGILRYISSLAVGGNHITHDLAVGLRTPVSEAERIKRQYGRALRSLIEVDDVIDVQGLGSKEIQSIPRTFVGEIIECRMEEILSLALSRLQQEGLMDGLSAGAVLTGGASVMPGATQLAESLFEMPVRLGLPTQVSGLTDLVNTPMYASGVGLALMGRDRQVETVGEPPRRLGLGLGLRRVATWFQNFF